MVKLYPPKIENILPAFTTYENNIHITIPYSLNLSVGKNDFNGISYIIKSATTNLQIVTGVAEVGTFNSNTQQYEIKLILSATDFDFFKGQYYKIQIAFIKDSEVGYYSNTGIAKYIVSPEITVNQSNLREITGIFKDSQTQEKVYSYSFNLYDEFNNIIETSGELIHNSKNDTKINESEDHWEIQTTLQSDIKYFVKYLVTTTGNYSGESNPVLLQYTETLSPKIDADLYVENNFEEGYNRIYLERKDLEDNTRKISGNFILLRASQEDDYKCWEKLIDFQIYKWEFVSDNLILEIYKDYFIEQGISYRYAIQAYNSKNIYSTKLMNKNGPVYSDFEDIFLYDGERQLKIRFNPKINNFKSTLLESKIDTIGGKHPHFFRNGNVNYKEFSLSGLISVLEDKNNEFAAAANDSSLILSQSNTDLNAYNYQQERDFKLQVLSWLTNGKEKILKTAAEGNYIIRLMNTTLTPNDTLGRMLHTFTSTAYEVADFNFNNLKELGFIDKSNKIKRIKKKLSLTSITENIIFDSNVLVDQAIIYTLPNKSISYKLQNGNEITITSNNFGIIDLSSGISSNGLLVLYYPNNGWGNNSYIEYSYLNKVDNTDDWYWITRLDFDYNKFETILGKGLEKSIKNELNTNSQIISDFPYIEITKRTLIVIYKKQDGKYYEYDSNIEVAFDTNNIYQIYNTKDYIDGNNPTKIISKSGLYWINLNGDWKNLEKEFIEEEQTLVFRNIQDFSLGQGLKAKIHYPVKILTLRESGGDSYVI